MNLSGPYLLRLGFHIFVVIVGGLILSGAVNTSIIGANGVLNRVAEDGVLLPWFRKPHRKFGTTYRIINLIAMLQIATIIGSRGDMTISGRSVRVRRGVELLHEVAGRAGAALPAARSGIQIPVQLPASADVEIPVGLGVTTLVLGFVAIANLFSKQIATKYGVAFTIVFFVMFTISEHINLRKQLAASEKKGTGAVQSGSPAADRPPSLARAPRLRAGGRARLPPHGAPEARAREDQSAAARHRGDDGAPHFDRRRRIRSFRRRRSSAITKRSCSATWSRWPRRKASRWSCWWCRR